VDGFDQQIHLGLERSLLRRSPHISTKPAMRSTFVNITYTGTNIWRRVAISSMRARRRLAMPSIWSSRASMRSVTLMATRTPLIGLAER
jgi:hypothetical protein